MAWTNLRHSAFQLVPWPPDYLSRNFRRRILPIDLSHSAIRSGSLPQQYRMVRPYHLSLRRGCVCSAAADCAVFDAGWHAVCLALLYGACAHRAALRYHPLPPVGHVPGFRATARSWLVPLFYLAAFQTHSRFCNCATREAASRSENWPKLEPPRLLERRRQGSSQPLKRNFNTP